MSRLPVLAPVDMGRTAAAFLLTAVVEVGLRALRLPRLASILGVPIALDQQPLQHNIPDPVVIPRWARRRLAASRRVLRHWPFGDTCLRQALVGGAMIRSLEPALRIGVTKRDGGVRAHAWIEIEGISLDPGSKDFASIERTVHSD